MCAELSAAEVRRGGRLGRPGLPCYLLLLLGGAAPGASPLKAVFAWVPVSYSCSCCSQDFLSSERELRAA